MSGQVFRHAHRVTYAECTMGNHIYYARYLDLLEAARGEFFRHLGQPFLHWQNHDTLFPVVECRIHYKGSARYDDQLIIEIWLAEMERVRLTFAHRILNEAGRVLVECSTIHACTSLQDKPKRLPAELAGALRPFLQSAATTDAADAPK